jgi:hypothetical protein
MKLASLLIAILATGFWYDPNIQAQDKTGQVRFVYEQPTNPDQVTLYNRMKTMRVLERLSEFLSPLRLPRPLTLRTKTCGKVNAFYWRDEVTACYEYFKYLMTVAPDMPTPEGLTRHDALAGMTADLFLHESGHAVFDMLGVPFLGREEDAADEFSAYILLQMAKDDTRRLILGVAFLGSKQAQDEMEHPPTTASFADIHEFPTQRYFNVLCMAYGNDPNLFGDAIDYWHLPESRAKNCSYEYRHFAYAFHELISPYIDYALVDKVRAERLLNYDAMYAATE